MHDHEHADLIINARGEEITRLKRELEEARALIKVETYVGPDELRKRCGELFQANVLLTKERDELRERVKLFTVLESQCLDWAEKSPEHGRAYEYVALKIRDIIK